MRPPPAANLRAWIPAPNLLAAIVLAGVAAPAFAFDVSPDPDSTEGSVRIGGHDRAVACGHAKEYRGPMSADRRDEVLLRYGLPAGPQPELRDRSSDPVWPSSCARKPTAYPQKAYPRMKSRAQGTSAHSATIPAAYPQRPHR